MGVADFTEKARVLCKPLLREVVDTKLLRVPSHLYGLEMS
jgi:hypothetical protein